MGAGWEFVLGMGVDMERWSKEAREEGIEEEGVMKDGFCSRIEKENSGRGGWSRGGVGRGLE